MNYIYLIGATLIFGILGGIVNAIREKSETKKDYFKGIIKGISAAFLVPFFLFIIRSEIATNLGDDIYEYLIYGGFCLIASIFSDNFFDGIADRVLQKVKNAEQIAKESNEKANTLINKKAEPEKQSRKNTKKSIEKTKIAATDPNSAKIIKALESKEYEFRTISGIAEETQISKPSVHRYLTNLEKMHIVKKINSGKRNLWTLNQ
ncbi:YEATS-associated helix-containing protein [Leeuwenhoekiella sp. A2]|uniref:YEATS-associated helix-containing protein n=1 Tax=Leeuwenhoekiella sp. A2 TaxID=3141460 RepID=UPI003A810756